MIEAQHLTLLSDLSRALAEPGDRQIVPFYQPQVDLASGKVIGAEALLRWRHPIRGLLTPEQVVRVAEHSPVMQKISMTMFDQVLTQIRQWQDEGIRLVVSVNVSVRDLYGMEFVDWLSARVRHYGVDPACLQVELTETALMNQTEPVLDALTELHRLGIGASLDDFGTGFSSLQHLRQLPLTEIKIDRSFVQAMMGHAEEESIVRAVLDLGRELGLLVVAEGVEDETTKMRLIDAGCRVAQGWHFGKAMPADEFARWLGQRARPA
jgi:EAL domain-containing protein (putative c-di-GMP-specific phosphodiesterase class I)